MEPGATLVNGYSISRERVAGSEDGIRGWLQGIGMLDRGKDSLKTMNQ